MMPFYFGIDPTYILVIIGIAISGAASAYVNSTFRKYDQVRSSKHVTGTQAAQYILQKEQINDVGVQQIAGDLTDNYNSGNKMLSLSEATAQSTSVAAIGVAAHECGHAVQDHTNYVPLRLRAAIVPVANIGSTISFPLILIGVLFSWNQTLSILSEGGLLTEEEVPMARKVLFAAALTYVAAALSTFLQLLRLVILFGGNNRRD